MRKVDIVFFDAASGHRSAAVAIQKALSALHPEWRIRTVNITDIFDGHKSFGWTVRKGIDIFNKELVKDRVFDLKGKINLALLCHDLVGEKGVQRISSFWSNDHPDAIISVTPMYNPVLYTSARHINPNVKCITIPVDFEEAKPRYWFTPAVQQYYINATDRLEEQAKKAGITNDFLFRIPGMVVDPDCYQKPEFDKKAVLTSLSLDTDLPTGFVSFGGQGSLRSLQIAELVHQHKVPVNLIFSCGKNEKLFKKLSNLTTVYPKAVFSYFKESPLYYLHLSDFAIGKPGAMTITEALVTETPQIALKSTGLRPVQKGNEAWLIASGTGLLATNVKNIVPCLINVLSEREKFKQNIEKNTHKSIFICADLISTIILS